MNTNTTRTVLISTSSFGRQSEVPLQLLKERGIDVRLNPHGRKLQPKETVALLQGVDGLVAGTELLDRQVLSQAPRLQVISRCGVGMDNVDRQAASELGIGVYNTADAHVDGVAELTLAGALAVLRRVAHADAQIREGHWQKPMGRLLRGRRVGIIGLGRVGKALVRLLEPFQVEVLACDPQQDPAFAQRYGVTYCDLQMVLERSDIVSLHVPYAPEHHHMLDREALTRMKPGSVLVNTARGGLVDELVLVELLQAGRLAGAYLDTFQQEPYVGPLIDFPQVVLTPHIGSYAAECRIRMETEAVENLLRHFDEVGLS